MMWLIMHMRISTKLNMCIGSVINDVMTHIIGWHMCNRKPKQVSSYINCLSFEKNFTSLSKPQSQYLYKQ